MVTLTYEYAISDFFEELTYIGEGHIPEDELAIYRNGYQLDLLPTEARLKSYTIRVLGFKI